MSERFVAREEIQFRCYLQYTGPFTSDDHVDAMAEWERRAKDRFGQCQFGHVHITAHDPVPVFWEPGQAHGVRGDGVGGSP